MIWLAVICLGTLLIYTLLLIVLRSRFLKLKPFASNQEPSTYPFITVIVPARNEALNIGRLIASIQNTDYPKENYEIIVADDFSTDGTAEICSTFKNVNVISLKDHIHGHLNSYKKKGIELAIKKAKGNIIVCTDADCVVPPGWLKTITLFYQEKQPVFVAMPVRMQEGRSFLSRLQSMDFLSLQGVSAACAGSKIMMCNGANLSYTHTAFDAVDGFSGIDEIASGDDMLLMHKIEGAFSGKVAYLFSKDVIVDTMPERTWKGFLMQRIRWASKSKTYKHSQIKAVLALVYAVNLFLLTFFMACFFMPEIPISNMHVFSFLLWVILLIIKVIAELIFLFPVATFFSRKRSLLWFPMMQPFHILYTVIAGTLGNFGTYQWKGRTVK